MWWKEVSIFELDWYEPPTRLAYGLRMMHFASSVLDFSTRDVESAALVDKLKLMYWWTLLLLCLNQAIITVCLIIERKWSFPIEAEWRQLIGLREGRPDRLTQSMDTFAHLYVSSPYTIMNARFAWADRSHPMARWQDKQAFEEGSIKWSTRCIKFLASS